jgi:hypothetical protein
MIMKFVSIIFAASVASTLADERGLQTLAKKWNITDPTFAYEKLRFDLNYDVSDFINDDMTGYKLYTPECKEGGVLVTDGSFLSTDEPALTGDGYDPNNNGNGIRKQAVSLTLLPSSITASNIYAENTTVGAVTATIDFCVRFSLETTGGTEVNFLETLVTLFVDLSEGFTIGEINVEPKVKLTNTANQVYLLDGYQCNADNTKLTTSELSAFRNQGSVIRVCVKPDADAELAGIKMRSLDAFTFTRVNSDETIITQDAITGSNEQAPNGLTSLICISGSAVCHFETILIAAFYTSLGSVLGSGTGSMQFGGGRRLLRALQAAPEAAATSEFELNFGVNLAVRDDRSSAATRGVMAATALVVAGAFTLL